MKEYIFQAKYQETMSYFDSHKLPELIRCKDCVYWDSEEHNCNMKSMWFACDEDWFCADAEKKECVSDA